MSFLKTITAAAAAIVLSCAVAAAQSVPIQLSFGQVPTPGQWALAFSSKQDMLGFRPLNSAGGTMTGKLWLMPANTFNAGLNFGIGNAPTTPQNGDMWMTSSGLYVEVNGSALAVVGGGLAPGTTNVSPSTNGGVLFDNNGILGDSTTLPSGLNATNMALTTPSIGAGAAITSSGPGGALAAPAFASFGTANGNVAEGGVITAVGRQIAQSGGRASIALHH